MSIDLTQGPRGSRGSGRLRVGWRERIERSWRTARPKLLFVLPLVFAGLGLVLLFEAIRTTSINQTIRALKANHDEAVSTGAPPELLLAQIEFLIGHERLDEAQPFVEALDRTGSDKLRAVAHYDVGNGRLRKAFDLVTGGKLDEAGPLVVLSRQDYRRALTFEPDYWDAKFNLDVASRLIRDFPEFERTMGDDVKADRKKIWTDVPGRPEGLP